MNLNDVFRRRFQENVGDNYAQTEQQKAVNTPKTRKNARQKPAFDGSNMKSAISSVAEMRRAQEERQKEEGDEDNITLKYILREKPKIKVVREFFRANLTAIPSAEEMLFT
jgi:hypothetical protein